MRVMVLGGDGYCGWATALYLFGSTARDGATFSSDLDLFIDYDLGGRFSLVELVGIKQLLERRLGVHPLFVFISIFGGLAAFGPAGLFLGPLIIALTVAALDLYEADGDGPAAGAGA